MSDPDYKEGAEFLLSLLEAKGIASTTVSNGCVIMFKRDLLEQMLKDHPDQDKFIFLVKKNDVQN